MAVAIEIKQTKAPKKVITAEEIAALKNLEYGVLDDYFVLDQNRTGSITIVYDPRKIGRGIEVSQKDGDVSLRLPLPTSESDIKLFYSLAEEICKVLGETSMYRDEVRISARDAYLYASNDIEASVNGIDSVSENIRSKEMQCFYVFGALNPITLGEKEINEINGSLKNFEDLMDRLQQIDAFYSNPHFYKKKDGTIFGVYFVGEEIECIVPKHAHAPFNCVKNVSEWYVMTGDSISVPYDEFIEKAEKLGDYDSKHIIAVLRKDTVAELTEKYAGRTI